MKFLTRILFSLIIILPSLLIAVKPVQAAGKFDYAITREYWLNDDLTVTVKETEKITNNTSSLYIPSGTVKDFEILSIQSGSDKNKDILTKSANSVKVKYNGANLNFSKTINADNAKIKSSFPYDLNPGKSITFTMEYTHYGMTEKNGALVDFFLNGFAEDSEFEGASSKTTYTTHIYAPKDLPAENFINPAPEKSVTSGNYNKHTFSQKSLIGHYVWMQFGRTQFYKFEISQPITNSERINTGNRNRYEIVIPRSIEEAMVKQTIYYTEISPAPEWIKEDENGNLLASFKLKTNFEGDIKLKGYAKIEKLEDVDLSKLGITTQVPKEVAQKNLDEAEYWEVSDPAIKQQASSLQSSDNDVDSLVTKTYDFVVNRIDYSNVKRFGLNERQGAVKTLNGGAAVCMEYSDLFLTLMRAQGVPTRAAFGYGYDPKVPSDSQESHQWVQVYSPELDKWISVDVTWGENGPALVGGDLNHFFTHVASESPNDPPGLVSYGFGELQLNDAKYSIDVIEDIPNETLMTQEEVLAQYPYTGDNLAADFVELAQGKVGALYNNVRTGSTLSIDQIIILVSGVLLVGSIFIGLVKSFTRKKPLTSSLQS